MYAKRNRVFGDSTTDTSWYDPTAGLDLSSSLFPDITATDAGTPVATPSSAVTTPAAPAPTPTDWLSSIGSGIGSLLGSAFRTTPTTYSYNPLVPAPATDNTMMYLLLGAGVLAVVLLTKKK